MANLLFQDANVDDYVLTEMHLHQGGKIGAINYRFYMCTVNKNACGKATVKAQS